MFSKIIPSFFTIKEGSTFLTKPLFPQEREDVTALRCSEPLRYKVGGPSKVCAMVVRDGTAFYIKCNRESYGKVEAKLSMPLFFILIITIFT